ncbi:MAG: sugar transferase [Candidatus Peregrinibacteria bacterium]|nr:sugar transferase [Candidatus Peregrinibacteria bacterium]
MKPFLKILDQSGLTIFILMVSDVFWMSSALVIAYFLRNDVIGPEIQPFMEYVKAMPVVSLILLVTFYWFGLYERSSRTTKISELYNLFRAITLVWLLVMAASFLYKYDYSRIFVIMFYVLGLGLINFGRYLVRMVYRSFHRKGMGVTRVLIIGAGKPGKQVAKKLSEYDEFGYRVIGYLDNYAKPKKQDIPLMGGLDKLLSVIQHHQIQEVFVADPRLSHQRILELIHQCEKTDVKFKIVSDLFEIVAGDINLNELEGLPSLNLKKRDPNRIYLFLKRLMDILFSIFALVLLLPILLLIMIAIRVESKGKTIFQQKRVGKKGKEFIMYKFRTMHVNTNPNDYAPKDSGDKRITKVGKLLRKTSLDEWPQFWNVLKGEMSIVGPRPEMPFIVKTYTDWQRRRLDVKPGITGLWQILGRKDLPLHENIEYDFYYIKNQSLLLDLVILIKTVAVVFKGKGAY